MNLQSQLEDAMGRGVKFLEGRELGEAAKAIGEADELLTKIKQEDNERFAKQEARIAVLEERLNAPTFTGPAGGEKAVSWTDDHGREFKSARGKQRLSDLHDDEEAPFGNMVKSIITGQWSEHTKSMMVSVDPSAGYLTRPDLSNYVVDLARDKSVLAAAGVVTHTLPEGLQSVSYLRQTSDPTAAWIAEGVEIPESAAAFGLLQVKPRKMGVLVELTRESVTALNGGQLIEDASAAAVAMELDRVALLGSGAGQEPIGLYSTAGTGTITGVGDVHFDNILQAIATVENANFKATGGIWSPNTAWELSKLKEAETLAYLQPPAAFTALPKHVTRKATDALAFVGQWDQLAWCVGGLLGGLRIEWAHSNFKADKLYLRLITAADVVCFNPGAFCVLSGLS